jgi:hypothetical protein
MEYAYENDVVIEKIKSELTLAAEEINNDSQIINDTSVYSIT